VLCWFVTIVAYTSVTRVLEQHGDPAHGRNFDLKSGGYQFRKRTRRPWVPRRGKENGEEVTPSPSDSGVCENIMSSPSGVQGRTTAKTV